MAISNAEPKAYHLRHPEHDTPAMAEYHGYWQQNGRNVGLKLQFQGEAFTRHLTYKEVARLQQQQKEGESCT